MKNTTILLSGILFFATCSPSQNNEREILATAIEKSITTELLNKWYPTSMDTTYGGFLSTWTFDFKPTGEQNKMIVSQSRHVWTCAKAFEVYKDVPHYKACAEH